MDDTFEPNNSELSSRILEFRFKEFFPVKQISIQNALNAFLI